MRWIVTALACVVCAPAHGQSASPPPTANTAGARDLGPPASTPARTAVAHDATQGTALEENRTRAPVGPTSSSHDTDDAHEPSAAALARARKRFAHEPGVTRIVAAALRAMGRDTSDAMAARARAAGWVPRLGLSARRGTAVDLSDSATGADGLRLSTDDDLTLGATLSFELDRVVFRREEVALARERRAHEAARQERTREVVRLYFLRRRLQLEQALGASGRLERALRIAELEAVLDAFTGGAFQRIMGSVPEPSRAWKTDVSTGATTPRSRPSSKSTATSSRPKPGTSPKAASR